MKLDVHIVGNLRIPKLLEGKKFREKKQGGILKYLKYI